MMMRRRRRALAWAAGRGHGRNSVPTRPADRPAASYGPRRPILAMTVKVFLEEEGLGGGKF